MQQLQQQRLYTQCATFKQLHKQVLEIITNNTIASYYALLSMGILQVGDLDFLNRFKPAQKPECFHFEQNSPNKVKLVQKNTIFWKTFKFW